MAAWLLVLFVVSIALAIMLPTYLTFDRLVRQEHEFHLDAWVEDGRPIGMFWRPEGGRFSFRSRWAMDKCTWGWLFRTPDWARTDEKANRLLRRYRRLVVVLYVSLIVAVVAAIYVRAAR